MSDEPDKKEDPAEEFKQGLSLLWRAACNVGREVKKEVDRSDLGKVLDGAGREFVRAAANVIDRIANEMNGLANSEPTEAGHGSHPPEHVSPDADAFDGVKPKPKSQDPTAQDPGFRIAVDDDTQKKPE